jgi:N-dimethylarginine dimethylaminohydrolase
LEFSRGKAGLDEDTLLGQLEELAHSLGIEIRYEPLKREGGFFPGGLCRIKEEYVLILNSAATTEDKIQTMAKALNRFDLSRVYLRPGLREFLDKA